MSAKKRKQLQDEGTAKTSKRARPHSSTSARPTSSSAQLACCADLDSRTAAANVETASTALFSTDGGGARELAAWTAAIQELAPDGGDERDSVRAWLTGAVSVKVLAELVLDYWRLARPSYTRCVASMRLIFDPASERWFTFDRADRSVARLGEATGTIISTAVGEVGRTCLAVSEAQARLFAVTDGSVTSWSLVDGSVVWLSSISRAATSLDIANCVVDESAQQLLVSLKPGIVVFDCLRGECATTMPLKEVRGMALSGGDLLFVLNGKGIRAVRRSDGCLLERVCSGGYAGSASCHLTYDAATRSLFTRHGEKDTLERWVRARPFSSTAEFSTAAQTRSEEDATSDRSHTIVPGASWQRVEYLHLARAPVLQVVTHDGVMHLVVSNEHSSLLSFDLAFAPLPRQRHSACLVS